MGFLNSNYKQCNCTMNYIIINGKNIVCYVIVIHRQYSLENTCNIALLQVYKKIAVIFS